MPTTTSTNSAALVMPDPAAATNTAATQEIPDIRGLKDVIDIPTGNEWVLWLFVAAAALVVAGVARIHAWPRLAPTAAAYLIGILGVYWMLERALPG